MNSCMRDIRRKMRRPWSGRSCRGAFRIMQAISFVLNMKFLQIQKMNIKLNIEILIEELRTTILWGNVCFIFCICRNFIFKTNDIACIIRNAPLQLLPDQGRRIFRRMSLIQLFIVFVLDIQRKITAVQDSVPGSLLHQ